MFSLTHGENGSGATSAGRRIGSSRELPTRLTTPADSARRNARLRASQVRVSQPEDVAERDADRAADLIAPEGAAGRGASRSPVAYAPPVVWDAIDSPGRLLDGHERPSAPGIDLAAVRLHEGGLADRSARALEAAAYTVGDDIVVGDGYDSHSAAGRRLLVHELTHVAQQRRLMFAAHDSAPGSGVSGLAAARQPLPARGAPGADPDEERARRLSRLLRDSPEAALTELKALSETELDALDDKAAKVLRGADASLVHHGVEFVLYWRAHNQPAAKSGDMPKPGEEGESAPKADATVSGGTVAVRLSAGGGSGLGYTLTYTTSTPNTVADARWLQFAWREVVVERSVKGSRSPNRSPLEKRIGRPFGGSLFQYWLTTDPAHPNWNTDTSEKSSPFFEESTGTVTRTNTTLAMFDRPTAQTELVRQAFAGAPDRPLRVVERFHAAVYLVRGMNVLYRAEIDLSRPFLNPDDAPKLVATATGEPANAIAPEHRARLLRQFPDLDYLPGPALPAPHLRPEFGFIHDPLSEKAWAAKTNVRERLADVAQIAQANRIDDVWELTASAINETTEGKDGAHVEPGLNLAAKGKSTSGFVDEHKTFHAVLPANEQDLCRGLRSFSAETTSRLAEARSSRWRRSATRWSTHGTASSRSSGCRPGATHAPGNHSQPGSPPSRSTRTSSPFSARSPRALPRSERAIPNYSPTSQASSPPHTASPPPPTSRSCAQATSPPRSPS